MSETNEPFQFHLHLVSDATGETISSVARACLIQFDKIKPIEHFWNLVRTESQLKLVFEGIRDNPGIVMFTLVDDALRRQLYEFCRETQILCVPVLDPLINALAKYLGHKARGLPGRQYVLDAEYFSRIDAVDFALAHDDGQSVWDLHDADVVLLGVSRSSKTPTCIYLANKGVRAANVPYVPGCPVPPELDQITKPLVIGLTKDVSSLVEIRRSRMKLLNQPDGGIYVDPETVRAEVIEAKRFFSRRGWPVIDVSRRSVEETAAEVLSLLSRRQAGEGK